MVDACSICLDSNFVDSDTHENRKFITKCNHVYHHDCIYRWAQRNNSCPTCRTTNLIDEFINYNYYDDSNYNNILSSIITARLNIGNLIEYHNPIAYNNFDVYLENLTDVFTYYYRNLTDIQDNIIPVINLPYPDNIIPVINLPNPDNPPEVINLRMNLNTSRTRSNHRLGSMNFRA
tara:strand:+ start:921 stop:1451 length:531 start_codon:yes stop_codon:yes gene_type:complete